jgi:hypothetical protein
VGWATIRHYERKHAGKIWSGAKTAAPPDTLMGAHERGEGNGV